MVKERTHDARVDLSASVAGLCAFGVSAGLGDGFNILKVETRVKLTKDESWTPGQLSSPPLGFHP